jgi:hypothetical protein
MTRPSPDEAAGDEGTEGAEGAAGAALAVRLLLQLPAGERQARLYGGFPSVVRFGAAAGRLRRPLAHRLLGPALGQARTAGWTLAWRATPRWHNQAADALATQAALACGPSTDPAEPLRDPHVLWLEPAAPLP